MQLIAVMQYLHRLGSEMSRNQFEDLLVWKVELALGPWFRESL
jgi:hypothetical protein